MVMTKGFLSLFSGWRPVRPGNFGGSTIVIGYRKKAGAMPFLSFQ